jgi:hypothetical protein
MILLGTLDACAGRVVNCAGNRGEEIATNFQLTKMVFEIAGRAVTVKPVGYEPGKLGDGKPISFEVGRHTHPWKPRHALKEGLLKTFNLFEDNEWRYRWAAD